jgi:hypothetical protein
MITHMPCLPSKTSLAMISFASLDTTVCAALLVAAAVVKANCVEVKVEVDVDMRALSNESVPHVNANGSHLQQEIFNKSMSRTPALAGIFKHIPWKAMPMLEFQAAAC